MTYGSNQWDKGTFACFSNIRNCCCGFFFMPCAVGEIYQKLGYESCFTGCCSVGGWAIRDMVRKAYKIEGSCMNDCMCAVCCDCCSLVQVLNQVTCGAPAQQQM